MIKINVSELMGRHKMTQRELAKQTGIRPATISALYRESIKRIEIDQIDSLCKALKCTPAELFTFVEDKEDER